MKLSQATALKREIQQIIGTKRSKVKATLCIVASEIFSVPGGYNIAVKKSALDAKAANELTALVNHYKLCLKEIDNYLVIHGT